MRAIRLNTAQSEHVNTLIIRTRTTSTKQLACCFGLKLSAVSQVHHTEHNMNPTAASVDRMITQLGL